MYTLSVEELQLLSTIHPTLQYSHEVNTQIHEFKNDKVWFKTHTNECNTFIVKDRLVKTNSEPAKAFFSGEINAISFSYLPKATNLIDFVTPDARELFKHNEGSVFIIKGSAYRAKSYAIVPPFTTMRHVVILVKPPLLKKALEYDLSFYKHIENELSSNYYEFSQSKPIYGHQKLNKMFRDIIETRLTGGMYKLLVEAKILEMFLEVFTSSLFDNKGYSSLACKVSEYLKDNIDSSHNMKAFERVFNVSKYRLDKEFHTMYGMSIKQYQKKLTYDRVNGLLDLGFNYSQIAKKLNFANQTHLKRFIESYQ